MQIQTIGFELKWINNKFMNCVSFGVLTKCLATSQNFIHEHWNIVQIVVNVK
jgi:hypothetical protein